MAPGKASLITLLKVKNEVPLYLRWTPKNDQTSTGWPQKPTSRFYASPNWAPRATAEKGRATGSSKIRNRETCPPRNRATARASADRGQPPLPVTSAPPAGPAMSIARSRKPGTRPGPAQHKESGPPRFGCLVERSGRQATHPFPHSLVERANPPSRSPTHSHALSLAWPWSVQQPNSACVRGPLRESVLCLPWSVAIAARLRFRAPRPLRPSHRARLSPGVSLTLPAAPLSFVSRRLRS